MNKSISQSRLKFKITAKDKKSSARACTFNTLHNEVNTPLFMPVATVGAIRSQDTILVESLGFPVLLTNTYHLMIRPGLDVLKNLNGMHEFINWGKSILSDSGGYQVFSLPKQVKIDTDGATFRSYLDGRIIRLTPETSIESQKTIGSDIMMALDYCVPSDSDKSICNTALDITTAWAERSLNARGDSEQSIFGIVQGARFPDLRKTSASQITSFGFDGFAIGGLAVGESEQERNDMTELTASLLPENMPRYLMGVGTPSDLLEAVYRGVDMFDCILPSALAQQGVAFTSRGRLELRRGVYKTDERAIDPECTCRTCLSHSRAFIHHLIKSGEYYGSSLVGIHNLYFYHKLMGTMRENILNGTFYEYYHANREIIRNDDADYPVRLPKIKKRPRYTLGNYEIFTPDNKIFSIRQISSGEVMHSVNDPVEEARRIYSVQLNLEKVLSENKEKEFIIWDVGLGAGTNAMAAIMDAENIIKDRQAERKITVISFENDLDPIYLAVKYRKFFSHLHHKAPHYLLKNGRWTSDNGSIEWILSQGDFLEKITESPEPDCIFYDFFSFKTDPMLWSYGTFRKIFSKCGNKPVKLFTYSNSTMVRSALLAAGFFVGAGPSSGPKDETTTACNIINSRTDGIKLLSREWLDKFRNSSAKWDAGCTDEEKHEIEQLVYGHRQFKNSDNSL